MFSVKKYWATDSEWTNYKDRRKYEEFKILCGAQKGWEQEERQAEPETKYIWEALRISQNTDTQK